MNADGNNSVPTPENWKQSSNRLYGSEQMRRVAIAEGSYSGSLSDAIAMHLVDCDQCREFAATGRPVPNIPRIGAGKDGHCDTYWQMQIMLAEYEGRVNNIVAHTEYGDEAPKGVGLE